MNKLIVAAVATAVSGFASVAAQAAPPSSGPASVTVVNSAAAPVPTTVQNTVGVDVLSGPATRARLFMTGCSIPSGSYRCEVPLSVSAPAGMVMRVVGLTGSTQSGCKPGVTGTVTLTGVLVAPNAGETSTRIMTTGTRIDRDTGNASTLLDWSGNAFFSGIKKVEFGLTHAAPICNGLIPGGEVSVYYVLEPLA